MKLKEARMAAGYTQEDIVRIIDVSLRHYQLVERGKSEPGVTLALTICQLLGINPFDVDEWRRRRFNIYESR